jgi:predicted MFS family arabinose efflux permease
LPELVDSTQLVIANSHLQAVELTADEMVGQAAGGFAFAAARYVPFLCDAASFALSAGFVATAVPDNAPTGGETTLWADLKDGLKWFARDPLMRLLTAVIASLAFCQAAVIGLLVLYGTQDLHLSKSGYGLLLGVSSVGGLTGAIGAGRIQARLGSGATLNLVGVVAALSYLALAETNVPFLAAGILAVEAMAVTVGIVTGRALRQGTVPQEMMGRVGSAARTVLFGVVPLGGLVGGLAAEHVGVRHTILMAGVLQMDALLLLAPRLIQRLREQRPA